MQTSRIQAIALSSWSWSSSLIRFGRLGSLLALCSISVFCGAHILNADFLDPGHCAFIVELELGFRTLWQAWRFACTLLNFLQFFGGAYILNADFLDPGNCSFIVELGFRRLWQAWHFACILPRFLAVFEAPTFSTPTSWIQAIVLSSRS